MRQSILLKQNTVGQIKKGGHLRLTHGNSEGSTKSNQVENIADCVLTEPALVKYSTLTVNDGDAIS